MLWRLRGAGNASKRKAFCDNNFSIFKAYSFVMKHVSILVPDGECSITTIEGTYQILLRVNDWLEEAGRPPPFNVPGVWLPPGSPLTNRPFFFNPPLSF